MTNTKLPCSGSNTLEDRNHEKKWLIGRHPVLDHSTRPETLYTYRIALLSDLTSWSDLLPPLEKFGIARFCISSCVDRYIPVI